MTLSEPIRSSLDTLSIGLTLGQRSLHTVSKDNGGPLKVHTVQSGGGHLSRDPLSTRTLHKVKYLQRALCP